MIPSLVILFWLAVIAAVVYRYRDVEPISEFLFGFAYVWYGVIFAEHPPDDWGQPRPGEPSGTGMVIGIFTLVGLGLTIFAAIVVSLIWSFS
jgi:hypothetical protein